MSPAAISFKMSDLEVVDVPTGISPAAIIVGGPGATTIPAFEVEVNLQPNVTVQNMTLGNGVPLQRMRAFQTADFRRFSSSVSMTRHCSAFLR